MHCSTSRLAISAAAMAGALLAGASFAGPTSAAHCANPMVVGLRPPFLKNRSLPSTFVGNLLQRKGSPESVLYRFLPGSDGEHPGGGLLAYRAAFYSTTNYGGSKNDGTVFKLMPSGSGYVESILYGFSGGSDGQEPHGALIADSAGAFYGTTYLGGSNNNGTVYKLTPLGSGYRESVLYRFAGGSDGANPNAGLIADKTGALYGTTIYGGLAGLGTVFRLQRHGSVYTETVLYSFKGGSDGALPRVKLLEGPSGALLGTTLNGGNTDCSVSGVSGCGIVFKLSRSRRSYQEGVLYRFQGGNDGANPYADVITDASGSIFGTTGNGGGTGCGGFGCGTAFKLTRLGAGYTETVLYRFKGGNDGQGPIAGIIAGSNGTLYGTTLLGGTANQGTAFALTPAGTTYQERLIYRFQGASQNDGANPTADLSFGKGGVLYSTTSVGGDSNNFGTVFKLTT